MASAGGRLQAYEKTSVELSYPSVVRFTGHVQLKGLSARTVESYLCMLRQLTAWGKGDPAELTEEHVRDYFLYLVRERKYAPPTLRQARASLGCFYLKLLGRTDWKVFSNVKAKDRERLPVVLSRDEVRLILDQVRELRYLAPLTLIYLCGLRLSEALQVEVRDIQRNEGRLHVREGKGGKDRMVPLPEAALALLGQWYRHHWHPRFLFPAMGHSWKSTLRPDPLEQARIQREQWQRADHPVSTSALQNVWRIALAASGVAKPATIHTLRHSYATHLLEEGVSLRYVSAYLGHASLEQTLVYAHLTAVSEAQTQEAVARMAAGLTRPTLPPIAPPAR
jgi:integrase